MLMEELRMESCVDVDTGIRDETAATLGVVGSRRWKRDRGTRRTETSRQMDTQQRKKEELREREKMEEREREHEAERGWRVREETEGGEVRTMEGQVSVSP
ncbi:hypothetical protein PAMP_018627 [Pampus punctatissimus]